ncbi:hypothetical protein [Nocardia sp. NPDC006630]|uniref:hypothetical protein n=1 Tax=Nocardia sp. NPDC006630 TaxID=3157181 RepID=UPI0033A9B41C
MAVLIIALGVTVAMLVAVRSDRDHAVTERDRVAAELTITKGELTTAAAALDAAHQVNDPADMRHAEEVATQYSVGAATFDYRDLDSWIPRLKANTEPQLATKFDTTAAKLRQILVPLQWVSNPTLITAKVMRSDAGSYVVDVFLDTAASNTQNAQPNHSTVVYVVTVDTAAGWQISDVTSPSLG